MDLKQDINKMDKSLRRYNKINWPYIGHVIKNSNNGISVVSDTECYSSKQTSRNIVNKILASRTGEDCIMGSDDNDEEKEGAEDNYDVYA